MKNSSVSLRRLSPLIFLWPLLMFSHASVASSDWRLEKDDENIQVYLRDAAQSSVKSFKATVKIKSTLATLVTIISDASNYPLWLHNARSGKTLSTQSQHESINYVVTKMPWPVVDRDLVFQTKLKQNVTNKQIIVNLDAKPKFAANVAGKVRIEKMKGSWTLTPFSNGEIQVVYEMTIDPGGNIPKWIVNAMTVDVPFYTLKNLRDISKESQYLSVKGITELR